MGHFTSIHLFYLTQKKKKNKPYYLTAWGITNFEIIIAGSCWGASWSAELRLGLSVAEIYFPSRRAVTVTPASLSFYMRLKKNTFFLFWKRVFPLFPKKEKGVVLGAYKNSNLSVWVDLTFSILLFSMAFPSFNAYKPVWSIFPKISFPASLLRPGKANGQSWGYSRWQLEKRSLC